MALPRRAWGVLIALVCWATPRWSSADPAAQARFHDSRAREAFEHKQYESAAEQFFLARRLAPNPSIDFNIALCLELLGRHEEAYMYFDGFLADEGSRVAALTERRRYAEEALTRLGKDVARLQVDSDPPGATIYLDRVEHGSYGLTPRVLAVPAGEHLIQVELGGHRSASAKVRAVKGESKTIRLVPQRITGRLVVVSTVPGTVRVLFPNGKLAARGRTPFAGYLPPGSYEVSVVAPDCQPWRVLTTIGEDSVLRYEAAPEHLPKPTGDLTVTSNVAGASIKLDGETVGFSPFVLPGVQTGAHRLSVASEGVVPWSGPVYIRPNERAWVTVQLDDPPEKARSPMVWALGGVGMASLAAGAVLGVMAAQRHSEFERAAPQAQAELRRSGQSFNTAGDILFISGTLALGASVYLYFSTERLEGGRSRATVARDAR